MAAPARGARALFTDHGQARALQADTFEQLGYGAENGTWRGAYLAGAKELREGQFGTPTTAASADLMAALTVTQVFDSIAVRVDGPRAWDHHITISWVLTEEGTTYLTELRNGALNHHPVPVAAPGTTTFHLTRPPRPGRARHRKPGPARRDLGRTVSVDGDAADLGQLVSLLAPVDTDFAVVTP